MNNNRKIEIQLPVILLIILIVVCSVKIFSIATDKTEEINQVEENNEQVIANTNILEENITNNKIIVSLNNESTENKETENKVSEDTDSKNKESNDTSKETTKKENKETTQTNTTSKKKTYTSIGQISIPSLGIKYKILSKTSESLLKKSVTKFWGPSPNEVGNLCIVGHNYKTSKFFGNLPKIKKGAKVYITDLSGRTLTYKVYKTKVIKEDDLSCTSQKTNGKTEITLITCYYEPGHKHATKRFIAKARAE